MSDYTDYTDGSDSASTAGEHIDGWTLPVPANDGGSTASSPRSPSTNSFTSCDERSGENHWGDALAEVHLGLDDADVVDQLFDMVDPYGFETLANTRDALVAILDETPLLLPTLKGNLNGVADGEVDVHAFDDYLTRWSNDSKLDIARHVAPGPCRPCEDEDDTDASIGVGVSEPTFPASPEDTDRCVHPASLTRPCVGEHACTKAVKTLCLPPKDALAMTPPLSSGQHDSFSCMFAPSVFSQSAAHPKLDAIM